MRVIYCKTGCSTLFEPGKQYTVRDDLRPRMNYPQDLVLKNIKANIRRPLPQAMLHPAQRGKALVLCGGPSLSDHWATIQRKRSKGAKLITMNGTHNEVLDRGMTPSAFVMLDARPHNERFVERANRECRYFLANQVHPYIFDALSGFDVRIWHPAVDSDRPEFKILDDYYMSHWVGVTGGTSVGPRAIWLTMMMGFRDIEIYGLDSSLRNGMHHAYPQAENDTLSLQRVRIGRKIFECHAWMIKQLDEWMHFCAVLPHQVTLRIVGDGAIAYLMAQHEKIGRWPKVTVIDTVEAK